MGNKINNIQNDSMFIEEVLNEINKYTKQANSEVNKNNSDTWKCNNYENMFVVTKVKK